MAQALHNNGSGQQLGFFARREPSVSRSPHGRRSVGNPAAAPLCAGCRAKEARYGFRRHEDEPTTERPRTLCFECFRVELTYRQAVAAQRARGWNASQAELPLQDTLNQLSLRRRRAQIAARKALGV